MTAIFATTPCKPKQAFSEFTNFDRCYDKIRDDIFTCAQKLTRSQCNLAHCTETNENVRKKLKTQIR